MSPTRGIYTREVKAKVIFKVCSERSLTPHEVDKLSIDVEQYLNSVSIFKHKETESNIGIRVHFQ